MISVSDMALQQLQGLMQQQEVGELGLRVFVTPGGCSGFQYGMRFEDSAMAGDNILDHNGVKLYVDEFSAQYLEGAEIDFEDALMGGGFTIHNPNAVTSCSCGQSFTSAQDGGSARPCGH
jgi:iron-sulfur cluster assembly protein